MEYHWNRNTGRSLSIMAEKSMFQGNEKRQNYI